MVKVIDIEIIVNSLFKSLFNCINYSEDNIINIINKNNKILIDKFKYNEDFEKNFYESINNIKKGLDNMKIGDDIIKLIDEKILSLSLTINNKINSLIDDIKSKHEIYCNHDRSQGRGKCMIMIKKEEDACYVHKKYIF